MKDLSIIIRPLKETQYSYDKISEIVSRAHIINKEKGLRYRTASMNAEEVEKSVGEGITYVALCDQDIVGTASVCKQIGTDWYDKGQLVVHYCFDAVIPEYQGLGIMKLIDKERDKFSVSIGALLIRSGTAEGNTIQRHKYEKLGFVPVDYKRIKGNNFCSVIYAKWIDKAHQPSKFICLSHFYCRKYYVRIRHQIACLYKSIKQLFIG